MNTHKILTELNNIDDKYISSALESGSDNEYDVADSGFSAKPKSRKKLFLTLGGTAAVLAAIPLCIALIVNVVSDNGYVYSAPSNTSDTSSSSASDTDASDSSVPKKSLKEAAEQLHPDTKIKSMSQYDVEKNCPEETELFKSMYGIPENKPEYHEDVSDDAIMVNISPGDYFNTFYDLTRAIASDDSPDIFPVSTAPYPYSICTDLFQPIDDIIDFDYAEWDEYRDAIESFRFKGHYYCSITDVHPAEVLWYKKSVIEEAGFDDPWLLYRCGKWTMSEFYKMCSLFSDPEKEKWALCGNSADLPFIATTGTPFVSLENGLLVSNLRNNDIIKCMDLLRKFASSQEGLHYPDLDIKPWIQSKALFFGEGFYRYDDSISGWARYKDRYKWSDDEVQFVPYPRQDGSEKNYQWAATTGYMLVKGSKNIEGYKAWVYTNVIANSLDSVKGSRNDRLREKGWTDELIARREKCCDLNTFSAVFEFRNGIDFDFGMNESFYVLYEISRSVYYDGEKYEDAVDRYENYFENRIKSLNETTYASDIKTVPNLKKVIDKTDEEAYEMLKDYTTNEIINVWGMHDSSYYDRPAYIWVCGSKQIAIFYDDSEFVDGFSITDVSITKALPDDEELCRSIQNQVKYNSGSAENLIENIILSNKRIEKVEILTESGTEITSGSLISDEFIYVYIYYDRLNGDIKRRGFAITPKGWGSS